MNNTTTTVTIWPIEEMKALEQFCEKHGIVGFKCGRIPPATALALLKASMGIVDDPLEERTPYSHSKNGDEKAVLHG